MKEDGGPSSLVEEPHHPDFPILWVSKGDLTEVSKKVKESISDSWKVKLISNTPRPGSLVTKDDISVWIQPDIGPDDTLGRGNQKVGSHIIYYYLFFLYMYSNF